MRALLLAGGLGLIGTLLGTRWAITILAKQGYGQLIRDDGPTSHHTKRGTPTMGGLVIILAVVFAYFGAKLLAARQHRRRRRCCCCSSSSGSALVGFVDDYIKIVQAAQPRVCGARRSSSARRSSRSSSAVLSLQFHDEPRQRARPRRRSRSSA